MNQIDSDVLAGKVCLVTGANTGIGRIAALELAKRGAHVVITCRNLEKGEGVAEELRQESGNADVTCLALELSSLQKVKEAAERFLSMDLPLHVLLNNAGLAAQRGMTDDGFELAFGVNHLGPALFTRLLEEKLKESAPARVVFVASDAHRRAKGGIDFTTLQQTTHTTSGFPEYAVSKLANLLYSRRLSQHLLGSGVTTYSLHPGVVATDVWRRIPSFLAWIPKLFMISADEGAKTSIFCSTDEGLASESGKYYQKNAVSEPNFHGRDDELMQVLWEKTEEWLAPFL